MNRNASRKVLAIDRVEADFFFDELSIVLSALWTRREPMGRVGTALPILSLDTRDAHRKADKIREGSVAIQTLASSVSISATGDAGTVALTAGRRGPLSVSPLEGALHDEQGTEERATPWFAPTLAVLVLLGVGLRIAFAVAWENGTTLVGDPRYFEQAAASLSHGNGYAVAFLGKGQPAPTALHPPVFPGILAILDFARLQSAEAHRIVLAFISAVSVVLMGLLGRRLMSPGAGLVAAAFAAFSPLWVQWGGRLLSESLYLVVIPLLLLVALESVDRPSWRMFGLVGLVIGVAALTRSEATAFVVVLGVPLVLLGSRELEEAGDLRDGPRGWIRHHCRSVAGAKRDSTRRPHSVH